MNKQKSSFFFTCKECILENPRSFYGSFSLGPFQNSQSLTIANALRRTLLTEIDGIAITHVQMDGIPHEYSTLDGVRESVLDIFLNLKSIRLKTSSKLEKPVYGYLNVRGPGIVRISDMKLPSHIQCVDPDQYIATLSENGKLSLKVVLMNSGMFFQTKEKQEKVQKYVQMNMLEIDPLFSPISKVNYSLENILQQNNGVFRQNQIVHIELWTNGSIHPRQALKRALFFLKNMFEKFEDMENVSSQMDAQFFESEENILKILKSFETDFRFYGEIQCKTIFVSFLRNTVLSEELQKEKKTNTDFQNQNNNNLVLPKHSMRTTQRALFDSSILLLELPSRVSETLFQNKIFKIGAFQKFSRKELLQFPGMGNFAVSLIQKKLKKYNIFL